MHQMNSFTIQSKIYLMRQVCKEGFLDCIRNACFRQEVRYIVILGFTRPTFLPLTVCVLYADRQLPRVRGVKAGHGGTVGHRRGAWWG